MRATLLCVCLLLAAPAWAQDATVEDKLRDALRHATVDLRALQDTQAQLQADRDSAVKQRDALQQQLDAANAQLAQIPKTPPPKPVDQDVLKQLQAQLDAAHAQIAQLQATVAKWQAAYRQAALIARQKDALAKQLASQLQAANKVNVADHETNAKLAAVANDILHLYRTQDFRRILLTSYEPLLGLDKVKLDNIVQDWEDKIYDLRIYSQKPAQ